MVAYSFQTRFRPPIVRGTKCQTIRGDRKRHARQGEQLQLYTGMRTRHCRLIGRALCSAVAPIRIGVEAGWVEIAGTLLTHPGQLDDFARRDGFDDWLDMVAFWRVEHPNLAVFSGVMVRWAEFTPTPVPA